MVKVFVTGVTGYIGGDAFYALNKAHPEWEFSALVRNAEKGKQVTDVYPKARTVVGDLDSYDLLVKEAAATDIIVHTADSSDHEGASKAFAEGLAKHTKKKPGYWLHCGGTGILTYFDSSAGKFGDPSDKEFNDWNGVDELTNLPHEAFHRNVDEIVLGCGKEHPDNVKVALVCPPTIYGKGRGPSHTRSRQAYELVKATLRLKSGPILGEGKARWNNVHVYDLSNAFLLLAEAAVAGKNDKGMWGGDVYYLCENGEHVWGELSKLVAKTAADLGFIPEAKTEKMDEAKAKDVAGFESLSWGYNSRGKAERLNKILGWVPKEHSIEEEIPIIVKSENEALKK
ncbi:hypothetical protein AAFC00_007027 [Neodothiora populina]|uniref:NAD-dependent epimerase/dehydratase domain-containing protein n=1 Tax=Neodothiora populina TaxID=2781224 RepID=A0ABR3PBY6_9PEZI